MYSSFYGFSDKPFETIPDSKFLFLSPSHQQALQLMMSGIRDRKGMTVVTGEVGTGKTTLIHSLLGSLDGQVETAFIFHTTITFEELLENILSELGLWRIGKYRRDRWEHLVRYTRLILARDGTLAIFIDEAQKLGEEVLEELFQRFFSSRSKHIQVILMGQPELEEKINSPALTQFKDRLQIRCQIKALSEDESKKYIHHRLRLAGGQGSAIFSPKALSMIYRYSRGIPRTINILCDNALLTGYSSSKKTIDEKIIRVSIKDLEGKGSQKPFLSFISDAVKATKWGVHPTFSFKWASLLLLSFVCLEVLLLTRGYLQRKSEKRWEPSHMSVFPLKMKEESSEAHFLRARNGRTVDERVSFPPVANRNGRRPAATVTVQEGETVSSLVRRHYGWVNLTVIDLVLDSNPEITNANLVSINQAITFPQITEQSLLLRSPDLRYNIHAGTFVTRASSKLYSNEPVLTGKDIEVIPRQVSPQNTWYRVIVGRFKDKEEALRTVYALKEKGLLPSFGNDQNSD